MRPALFLVIMIGSAYAQDLWERSSKENFDSKPIRKKISIQKDVVDNSMFRSMPGDEDLILSSYDLKANLKNILSSELREDFVREVLSSSKVVLASGAMNLLCQASPTLCNIFKHYRASANDLTSLYYNQASSLQNLINTPKIKTKAKAILKCMIKKVKKDRSTPIDKALKDCIKQNIKLRKFSGSEAEKLELLDELKEFFNLNEETLKELKKILGRTIINPDGVISEVSQDPLGNLVEELKRKYIEIIKKAAEERLKDIFGEDELNLLRSVDEDRRGQIIEKLAEKLAHYDLGEQVSRAQKYLDLASRLDLDEITKEKIKQDLESIYKGKEYLEQKIARFREKDHDLVKIINQLKDEISEVAKGKVQKYTNYKKIKKFSQQWGKLSQNEQKDNCTEEKKICPQKKSGKLRFGYYE